MRISISGVKAREALTKGADYLAEAVAQTVGPFGQNWFLQKGNKITNDGVSVAREIELKDEYENRGVVALREAAIKTNDEVGDGTTTATILAQAIYHSCAKYLAKEGVIAQKTGSEIIKQIETERKEVTEKLNEMATPIETEEQLINSATVAVEDKELGNLIGKTQWELGKEGRLIAEESSERYSDVEKIHGLLIDNGFGTSFAINNIEKQSLELKNIKILLTSYTIHSLDPLFKVIEQLWKMGTREMVIMARGWTEEAIKQCQKNVEGGGMKIFPMNAPYMDMNQRMIDLSAVLGGRYISSESGELADVMITDFGMASTIIARRFEAILAGMEDDETKKRVEKRITELKDLLKGASSDFERKNIQNRISQFTSGMARIRVGSPSEIERARLLDKCEDAVNAVRVAFQEGTVKGGGLAFKEIADSLPDTYILKQPLYELNRQIMSLAPSDFVIEDWVRDPVKVLRVALEKACVAASSFATAGGIVCDEKPKPIDELLRRNVQSQ